MKKLLTILFLCTVGMVSHAQSIVQPLYGTGTALTATVTNTGTATVTSKVVAGASRNVTVTATFTKLTGTVAGTASLQGSLNGTDWASASSTTYTVTDVASATNAWILPSKPFQYYRVSVTGSGTSTYTVKGQALSVNAK